MKFRRKPAEVDATRFAPGEPCEGVCLMNYSGCPHEAHVHTSAGPMCLNAGDWVVKADGRTWVVEAETFPKLYESATDGAGATLQDILSNGGLWRPVRANAEAAKELPNKFEGGGVLTLPAQPADGADRWDWESPRPHGGDEPDAPIVVETPK